LSRWKSPSWDLAGAKPTRQKQKIEANQIEKTQQRTKKTNSKEQEK
jgi:hypothetical protein